MDPSQQQFKYIIKEEIKTLLAEQELQKICAEFGYVLTEAVIQEINWSAAKNMLKKGITGLALIGALTGVAKPAMASEPAPGECSADSCSIELEVNEDEMKMNLADLIQKMIADGDKEAEVKEMLGWNQAEWGDHAQYLQSSSSPTK